MPAQRPTGEIRSLTGIRGIAACFVVTYHYFQVQAPNNPFGTFLLHGYLAVDLFFVLSGFVMALTYSDKFARAWTLQNYWSFIYKRLGRVYPLYLLVTIVGFAVACMDDGLPGWQAIVSNLTMTETWGVADSFGGPTWSISTEFAAYLAFPVLVAVTISGRRGVAWLAAAAAVALLAFVASRSDIQVLERTVNSRPSRNGPLDVFATTPFPLLRCLAGFTIGLLTFRAARHRISLRCFGTRHAGDAASAAVLALMFLPGTDVLVVVASVPLILCLYCGDSLVKRLLSCRVVHWLGLISYSIYVLHGLLDHLLRRSVMVALEHLQVPHAFTFSSLVIAPLLIGLSAATYYGIEKPARDWARLLSGARPKLISEEPAAP